MIKLSRRLQLIADEIPLGSRLADIGSDHALLPVYLAQESRIVSAVAGEINPGPLETARKQIIQSGCQQLITAREGNGLQVVESEEVDVVTIAGMGGSLIVQILNDGLSQLKGVNRLILQPNVNAEQVRKWLFEQHWFLSKEMIVKEDDQIYEILVADQNGFDEEANRLLYADRVLSSGTVLEKKSLFQYGPYLLSEGSAAFIEMWSRELEKREKIVKSIAQSHLEASKRRENGMIEEIAEIKEVLQCL